MKCPICRTKLKNGVCKNCGLDLTVQCDAPYYLRDPQNPNVAYVMRETGQSQPISSLLSADLPKKSKNKAKATAKKKNGWYVLAGILCLIYALIPGVFTYIISEFDIELALNEILQWTYCAYILLAVLLMVKASRSRAIVNLLAMFLMLLNMLAWVGSFLMTLPVLAEYPNAWQTYCLVAMTAFPAVECFVLGLGLFSAKYFSKLSVLSSILTAMQLVASVCYYLIGGDLTILVVYALANAFVFGGISLCMGKGIRAERKKS